MCVGANGSRFRRHNHCNGTVEAKAGRGSRSSLHLGITDCEEAVYRLILFYTRKVWRRSRDRVSAVAQFGWALTDSATDVILQRTKRRGGTLRNQDIGRTDARSALLDPAEEPQLGATRPANDQR